MAYKINLAKKAEKFYSSADKNLAKKLVRCFQNLSRDPRSHSNIKALKGNLSGSYRYRVDDYRVIYEIEEEKKKVTVLDIRHPSEAYR